MIIGVLLGLFHTNILTNKIKEVTFKILHRCYPCNSVLNKYMQNIEKKCTFCDLEETLYIFL